MNIFVRVAFCFLVLTLVSSSHADSNAKNLFSLRIEAPSEPIKLGAELRLKVTVTNISGSGIRFGRTPGPLPDETLSYHIEVRDEHGQIPPLTTFSRDLNEHRTAIGGSYITYTLAPGKSFEDELVITQLYTLAKPGRYTIWVARAQGTFEKDGKAAVRSNEITITVAP